MNELIAIVGAGGHAKCVYDCFYQSKLDVLGFFDDDPHKQDMKVIDGRIVLGSSNDIKKNSKVKSIFVAIGDNQVRLKKYEHFKAYDYNMPNAVHPAAHISAFVQMGGGNFLMAQAAVNPDSKIGHSCIINTGATIGHDCLLEDGVQLGPGVNVAGGSILGKGVFIGIGAKITPGVKIGPWSVIGAGAVVLKDIPGGVFSCGVPARIVRELS